MKDKFMHAAVKFIEAATGKLEKEELSEAISLVDSACKLAGIVAMLAEKGQ